MTLSIVRIVPAAMKTDDETVELNASGQGHATHYGSHFWADEAPEARDGEVISAIEGATPLDHFETVVANAGLKLI